MSRPAAPRADPATIPGLTMSRALLALPGRKALLHRVLAQFAQHYQGGLPTLVAAVAAGHWQPAQRGLHALRGACGAIGAVDLLARATTLEQALADHSADATLAQSKNLQASADLLQQTLLSLVDVIRTHLRLAP